jgi:hypothetical protein
MQSVYHDEWRGAAQQSFRDDRAPRKTSAGEGWDAHSLLTVMWDQWNRVFRSHLNHAERSLVSELREYRNRWAHQADFDFDDTYRILDSTERLLKAIEAEERGTIAREKADFLRAHFSQEARTAFRKAQLSRKKWHDFTVYLVCGGSLVFVIAHLFGWEYWYLSLFIVMIFSYLGYCRAMANIPVFFGPHECLACGKVIYREDCPYCDERS